MLYTYATVRAIHVYCMLFLGAPVFCTRHDEAEGVQDGSIRLFRCVRKRGPLSLGVIHSMPYRGSCPWESRAKLPMSKAVCREMCKARAVMLAPVRRARARTCIHAGRGYLCAFLIRRLQHCGIQKLPMGKAVCKEF